MREDDATWFLSISASSPPTIDGPTPAFMPPRSISLTCRIGLHVGVFFGSLHGTLNHAADRSRLVEETNGRVRASQPTECDPVEDRFELSLARARIVEDDRLITVFESYDEAKLSAVHSYQTTSGMPRSQPLASILMHLFNHQTHHRGHAHACLSILTGSAPPVPTGVPARRLRARSKSHRPKELIGREHPHRMAAI